MKAIHTVRLSLVGLLLNIGAPMVRADGLAIQSFSGTGKLTFNEIPNAFAYRVEWASSASGPWTNFAAAGASLDNIASTGSGIVTSTVPMFYRVVATVPPSDMVLIPGGTNAGTDPDFGEYSLTVSSFYMDRYEMTKPKWDEVFTWAKAHGYSFFYADYDGKATNHPIHSVCWYDAVKWCNARSQMEGRPAVYTVNGDVYKSYQRDNVVQTSAAGYRLPTDVEWEYAARGGLVGQRFPWGETIQHARANYYSSSSYSYDTSPTRGHHPTYITNGMPYTSPVGSFAANGYGLHDMAGNLREWCFDLVTEEGFSARVVHGASWGGFGNDAARCRVAHRYVTLPEYDDLDTGFRTVLPPEQ